MKYIVDGPDNNKDFSEYELWAENHGHTVQVSFHRSGRVWISSMVTFMMCKDINRRVPLDNYFFDPKNMSEDAYFTTHLYKGFPLFDHVRYVLLIRDPRSAILSRLRHVSEHQSPTPNFWDLVSAWIKEWQLCIDVMQSMNTLEIQYEKVCLNPVQNVECILDFAGLEIINTRNDLIELGVLRDKPGYERYAEFCYKWKEHVSMDLYFNDVIWNELQDTMIQYGYKKYSHIWQEYKA